MAKKEQGSLAGFQVLLVDDDLESLEALGELMATMGASVSLSTSASEALEQTAKLDFDVILSDVAMPGGDGLRLVKEFRDQPHTRKTICIAVTGMTSPGERERILTAGFDAHVGKPVHARELIELILRLSEDLAASRA